MAFIGVLLTLVGMVVVMVLAFVTSVVIFTIAPILIGTFLIRKTTHRILGIVIRIIGYLFLIPSVITGVILAVLLHGLF